MNDSNGNDEKSLKSWLGFPEQWQYQNAPRLGIALGIVLTALAILIGFLVVATLGLLLASVFSSASEISKEATKAISTYSALLLGIFGVPFLAWRSITAHRQANTAEQGLITDRISKAVEQIGAEKTVRQYIRSMDGTILFKQNDQGGDDFNDPHIDVTTHPILEVRIGGLYALSRVANDSPADLDSIINSLCSYVKHNLASHRHSVGFRGELGEVGLREDIALALTIISKQAIAQRIAEPDFLAPLLGADFTGYKIADVEMRFMNFENASFERSIQSQVGFDNCNLNNARFTASQLSTVHFHSCSYFHAKMDDCFCELVYFDDDRAIEPPLAFPPDFKRSAFHLGHFKRSGIDLQYYKQTYLDKSNTFQDEAWFTRFTPRPQCWVDNYFNDHISFRDSWHAWRALNGFPKL
jgi:hypothetical protein